MATIKEQVNKIMYYAHTTEEKILTLESSDYFRALKAVDRIEESFTTLEALGLMEDTCGCGGCEANINEAILETLDLDTLVTAFDDLAGDETALVALIAHIVESVNDYEVQ